MGAGSGARASARGDGPVYGLTVSGPGLVPYVDPAFRVGGGPVEIQVQPLSSLPRGKVAVAGGLLGDVDGNGRVDLADARLIEAYHADPSDPSLPEGIGAPRWPRRIRRCSTGPTAAPTAFNGPTSTARN